MQNLVSIAHWEKADPLCPIIKVCSKHLMFSGFIKVCSKHLMFSGWLECLGGSY